MTPQLAENQSSQKKKVEREVEDTDSTISDEQLVDQYEIMQRQMQRIRQEHLGSGAPQQPQKIYSQNPQAQKLLYQNQQRQEESSSELSSDDEEALSGRNQATSGVDDDSDSSSLQSEVNH